MTGIESHPTPAQPPNLLLRWSFYLCVLYWDLVLKHGIVALDESLFRIIPSLLAWSQTKDQASVTNLMWRSTLSVWQGNSGILNSENAFESIISFISFVVTRVSNRFK